MDDTGAVDEVDRGVHLVHNVHVVQTSTVLPSF